MRKIISLWLIWFFLLMGVAYPIEIVRQKNVATIIIVPIVDADGDAVTGAAGLDSEIDTWSDSVAPDGFVDCTNEATEIGTNGIYYLSLTQAECNVDYAYIQVKTTTSGAKTQHILIRFMVGDPLNLATTDDGGAVNVTGGAVDTVTTATTAATCTSVTNMVTANVTQISGDLTAADNAELAFDGTGYGFTGCAMPTTTSVTNDVNLLDATETQIDNIEIKVKRLVP